MLLIITVLTLTTRHLLGLYTLLLICWLGYTLDEGHGELDLVPLLIISAVASTSLLMNWEPSFPTSPTAFLSHITRRVQACWSNEQLGVANILSLYCICRIMKLASGITEEASTIGVTMTWAVHGETLLASLCGTRLSAVSLACLAGRVIDFLLMIWREFLGETAIEERPEQVLSSLSLLLALQSGFPGLEATVRADRLYRNLCLLGIAALRYAIRMGSQKLISLGTTQDPADGKYFRAILASYILTVVFCISTSKVIAYWGNAGTRWLTTSALGFVLLTRLGWSAGRCKSLKEEYQRQPWRDARADCSRAMRSDDLVSGFVLILWCLNSDFLFLASDAEMILLACFLWEWGVNFLRLAFYETDEDCLVGCSRATLDDITSFNDVCPICLEGMKSACKTTCSHFFHLDCLKNWLAEHNTCALCRTPLVPA